MRKMQALYEYLIGTGLVEATQLRLTVTDGSTQFQGLNEGTSDTAFVRNYSVQVVISRWGAGSELVDKLDIALTWWLSLYEPRMGAGGYGFEAELIDKETANLYIEIRLTERVFYKNGEIINNICPTINPQFIDYDPLLPDFVAAGLQSVEVCNADA